MTNHEYLRLLDLLTGPGYWPEAEWAVVTVDEETGEESMTDLAAELWRKIRPIDYEQARAAVLELRFSSRIRDLTVAHIWAAVSPAVSQRRLMAHHAQQEQQDEQRAAAEADARYASQVTAAVQRWERRPDHEFDGACARLSQMFASEFLRGQVSLARDQRTSPNRTASRPYRWLCAAIEAGGVPNPGGM